MVDSLYQELEPGDLIFYKNKIGVVYGETKSGNIRYYFFSIYMTFSDINEDFEDEHSTLINLGRVNSLRFRKIEIAKQPLKKHTNKPNVIVKINQEQYESLFENTIPNLNPNYLRAIERHENTERTVARAREVLKELYENLVNDLRNA